MRRPSANSYHSRHDRPDSLGFMLKAPAAPCLPSALAMSAIQPNPLSGAAPPYSLDQPTPRSFCDADLDLTVARREPTSLFRCLPMGLVRRWRRELRRRKVGRAYDMALEIARAIPYGSRVLDVGCGNGYIAHHLSALLGTTVAGIDLSLIHI